MRAARLILVAAISGTVVVTGVGAAVQAAPRPPCGGRVHDAGNGWQSIRPPFTVGGSRIVQVVATPYAPDRMYATNGKQVLQTDNAGCDWHPAGPSLHGGTLGVLPAPADGLLRIPATGTIVGIAAPSSATATDRVYVAWNDKSALGTTRPHISYLDATGNWREGSGLPRFGTVGAFDIAASPTVPTNAYAVVDPELGGDGGVYYTPDGGRTWLQRDASQRSAGLQGLRVDPAVNTWLYARGSSGLLSSSDGGAHFGLRHSGSDIASFDVAPGAGSSMLVAGHSSRKSFDRSNDGGASWSPFRAPIAARYVAMQPILDQVVVSNGSQVWLESLAGAGSQREITPGAGAPLQIQVTAPSSTGYAIVGMRGPSVLRTVKNLSNETVRIGNAGKPVVLLPHGVPHQFPSTLTPSKSTVTLPPGGHKDVTYNLLLPRTPSPVDIMFLVDTTASTDKTISGLKSDLGGIVNDLAATGLNADFGLADFKDYSPRIGNIGDGELGDYPYRLDRPIGRADSSLRTALNGLHARGGGDPAESQLTALYQSTTGVGQTYGKRVVIPSGQSAGYRSNALRLAVLATDERFHREHGYLTPAWSNTITTLRAHGVHPIGLAVETVDDSGKKHGFHSLKVEQELATATGSIAPAGGVDCNGDLLPDLAAGAPFVCKVSVTVTPGVKIGQTTLRQAHVEPVKLGPAITRAAETLPDLRAVGLSFSGANGIASVVHPASPPQVNVKNDNALTFTVRYHCPTLHKPRLYHLGVHAGAGARVVASSSARVACGAVPLPHQPAVPPAAAAAIVAAPAAAPAPAPPAQPIPNPNPNPNPNPALNANVGFASQEEEQRQLAFAGADSLAEEDPAPELSMSRLNRTPDGSGSADDPWIVGGAAVLLTGAAGYAARTRFAAAWHR